MPRCIFCQVWEVRVDVKVLNHAGNILDASCLAAIAALSHFKRPDVSVDDGKITIVSIIIKVLSVAQTNK